MEEDEEDQHSSIKARLLALIYKIKGQPQRSEREPSEKEQSAPCKRIIQSCAVCQTSHVFPEDQDRNYVHDN